MRINLGTKYNMKLIFVLTITLLTAASFFFSFRKYPAGWYYVSETDLKPPVSEIVPGQETAGPVKETSTNKGFHETRKPWPLKKNFSEDSKPVISKIATLTPQRVPLEINLVQYIHMLTDRHLREESGSEFDTQFLAREKEVLFVLGKNLNHSLVKTVHIIAEDKTMVERYLKSQSLNNWDKIVVHHNGKPCTYRDVFKYISDHLQDKTVMFANEDIYLGEGFERVDPVMMRDSKIMYVPTRHNSPAFGHCQDKLKQSNCSKKYIGLQSYDSYLFHLKEPVNDKVLREIDFATNAYGIENRCVWAFKTFMNFCILNPCTVLQTFHIHCSGLHGANRTRVNVGGKSAGGKFTTKLNCH